MSQEVLSPPNIADVFITEQLYRRAPKKTDYLQEKLALQELAARMADQPEDVLPRFVDLALEMTGGVSAGLSLYEENPAPGVFRWTYLRGALAPFEGATTPRDFSPCGITLDRNAPVLSLHPERVYDRIADANIIVPEVLLVPLYLGGKVPLGTLWIVFRNGPLGVKPPSDDLATVIVLPSVVDTRAATSCHQIGNRRANL